MFNRKSFLISMIAFGLSTLVSGQADGQNVLVGPRRNPTVDKVLDEISPRRIEAAIRKLVSFGTRHTLSDPDNPTRGIGAARRWIKEELDSYAKDSGGRLVVSEDRFIAPAQPRINKPTELVNLVATLKGDRPESQTRWFVVSGHYDSMPFPYTDEKADAPGANDDASGTAVSMELARVMSHYHFDATIVFLTVAGEEQGLVGSTHWADLAKREGRTIDAMLTDDIVGNTLGGNGVRENNRLRVFSEGVPASESPAQANMRRAIGGENDSPSRQLARYLKCAVERDIPSFEITPVFRRDRFGRGGDHSPFNDRGFAAVRLTEPNEDFTRQHERIRITNNIEYGDLPERVDFDYVAQVARVNASLLSNLALAPAAPAEVRFESAGQSYHTKLVWKRGHETDLAGYRIVWRATYEPFWTHAVEVADTTEATLKGLSKDDLFFAVQAVDKDGNASLPVFPAIPAPASNSTPTPAPRTPSTDKPKP